MPLLGTRGAASAQGFGFLGGSGAGLYPFTTFTFTNAGQTGPYGPSYATCTSAYGSQPFISLGYFSVNVQGIQALVVPKTGTYQIIAAGARGGNAGGYNTGQGRIVQAQGNLIGGTTIYIVVGQTGNDNSDSAGNGGGGGSFVYTGSNNGTVYSLSDLIVAAGGGSASNPSASNNKNGEDGIFSSASYGIGPSNPGSNGWGGYGNRDATPIGYGGVITPNPNGYSDFNNSNNYGSGGGAGFLGPGFSTVQVAGNQNGGGYGGNTGSAGSSSNPNGSGAWVGGRSIQNNRNGGFGGGGGGSENCGGSGGGGGYTGGAGNGCYSVGGAGTSYIKSGWSSQNNGTNNGMGYVTLTLLS